MKLFERKTPSGKSSFYIVSHENGKLSRLLLKGIHDRAIADLVFAEQSLRREREEAGVPSQKNLRLGECLHDYLENRAAVCAPKHTATLKPRIETMLAFFGADSLVRTLDEKSVNALRRHLKSGDRPCQVPTLNKYLIILKAACDLSVRQGRIGKNPLAGIEQLSDPRKPVWRWLKDEEITALLAVLRDGAQVQVKREKGPRPGAYTRKSAGNPKLRRLVTFLLNTGARRGEALAVTWRDVDLVNGFIAIHGTKSAAKGRKTRARQIPINAALQEVIEELRQEGAGADGGPLLHYPNGLRRDFLRACRLAGIKGNVRIHDLRHSAASHLAMNGTPLNTIREILGHATGVMTQRYAHLSRESLTASMQSLNFGAQTKTAKVLDVPFNNQSVSVGNA
ncbi:MAG: site-specific integrase [Candidatus Sumerlaeota bacterium]|nr:site-specific integrase [Candidatus Sumerlaeota bacterium]